MSGLVEVVSDGVTFLCWFAVDFFGGVLYFLLRDQMISIVDQ